MFKVSILILVLIVLCSAQSDGNPHAWDRIRRCDIDYEIPCGLCEGIGGIAYGDANNQIHLTTCTPVTTAAEMTEPPKPKFPDVFTNTGFYEVLISKKTNPFCVGGFPGEDSVGDLCYSDQEGTFIYDWTNKQLILDYSQVKGTVYNTSAVIYHQKGNMWIANDLKVAKQCICANPGISFNISIYPINPNFLDFDSKFLGREKLQIEYILETRLVDHWIKGPHHVWTDVETGYILRMWQPWNGLEVLDYKKWTFTIDSSRFVIPPNDCKKGGAPFRIKCNDDGTMTSQVSSNSFLW